MPRFLLILFTFLLLNTSSFAQDEDVEDEYTKDSVTESERRKVEDEMVKIDDSDPLDGMKSGKSGMFSEKQLKELKKLQNELSKVDKKTLKENMLNSLDDKSKLKQFLMKNPKFMDFYLNIMKDPEVVEGLTSVMKEKKKLGSYFVFVVVTFLIGLFLKKRWKEDSIIQTLPKRIVLFVSINIVRMYAFYFMFKVELEPLSKAFKAAFFKAP